MKPSTYIAASESLTFLLLDSHGAGATVITVNGSSGCFTPGSHSSCTPSPGRGNNGRRERCRYRREQQPPDSYNDLLANNSTTSRIRGEKVPERQPRWTSDHDPEPSTGTGFRSPSAASTNTPEHARKGRRRERLDRDSEMKGIKERHSPKDGLTRRGINGMVAELGGQGVLAERGRAGYAAASLTNPRGAFGKVDRPRNGSESVESMRSRDSRKARPGVWLDVSKHHVAVTRFVAL